MEEIKHASINVTGKPENRGRLRISMPKHEDNINIGIKDEIYENV
jgi:hypothetical protein